MIPSCNVFWLSLAATFRRCRLERNWVHRWQLLLQLPIWSFYFDCTVNDDILFVLAGAAGIGVELLALGSNSFHFTHLICRLEFINAHIAERVVLLQMPCCAQYHVYIHLVVKNDLQWAGAVRLWTGVRFAKPDASDRGAAD